MRCVGSLFLFSLHSGTETQLWHKITEDTRIPAALALIHKQWVHIRSDKPRTPEATLPSTQCSYLSGESLKEKHAIVFSPISRVLAQRLYQSGEADWTNM